MAKTKGPEKMPRKKGQVIKSREERLREQIDLAQRELAQIEVKACFDQFLADPVKTRFDSFQSALHEYTRNLGWGE